MHPYKVNNDGKWKFNGISVWQAATLFIHYCNRKDQKNIGFLTSHIESGPAVGGKPMEWEKLHIAINANNRPIITKIAIRPTGAYSWPDYWKKIGGDFSYHKEVADFLRLDL